MLRGVVTSPDWLRRVKAEGKRLVEEHQQFLLLLILFLFLRLSLLAISRPQGYFYGASDYDFYLEFGKLSDRGLYPMLQYWTEYPPIFPWMAVAAYRFTEAIPNLHGSPILWFRLALGSVTLLFDAGNLILIYWLGRTLHSSTRGLQCATIYALLFTPLHVWLAWFDTVPLFFLLLVVALTVGGRHGAAALAAGFGFMVKVFPILALPALIKKEGRLSGRVGLIAASALATMLVAAPFLVSAPRYLLASFQSMVSRSPWETPWALMEGYHGYGQVAPLEQRLDPTTASYVAYPTDLPWLLISAAFAAIYLLIWTRRFDTHLGTNVVALTGLTVNLFLLYSKGYSPQFLVYVVPFAVLVLSLPRAVGYLCALSIVNLLEYPVYITLFPDQPWVLRDLVLLRTLILMLMCWEYLVALGIAPAMERMRRFAAVGSLFGFVVWGVFALPMAGQEWVRSSQARHQNAALVDYLSANAGSDTVVVFTEQWLYRELYPYLRERTNLLLIDPAAEERVASNTGVGARERPHQPDVDGQLDQLSARYREIYGVRHIYDRGGKQIEQMLASGNRLEAVRRVKELTVSRWSTTRE